MIALSSSSIRYDYQLLFILYHGKFVIFCYCFLSLFVYYQRLCCLGYTVSAVVTRLTGELRFYSAIS